MKPHPRALVAVFLALQLTLSGCGLIGSSSDTSQASQTTTQSQTLAVSSGTLTIQVPKDWTVLDKGTDTDLIKEPWVTGALNNPSAMTSQVRLSSNTGLSTHADATNNAVLLGNAFAQAGQVNPGDVEKANVEGGDEAYLAYFGFKDSDGDFWDGLLLSAGNTESGNVATLELISLRGEGISQDEALKIVESAVYDKSQE